jgi:hypothetical protein
MDARLADGDGRRCKLEHLKNESGVSAKMPDVNLTEDSLPFREQPHTEEELEQYYHGVEAGFAGRRNDNKKTPAWQRGWADAQEQAKKHTDRTGAV